MIKDKADEITTEPLQSLLFGYRYQIEMKKSMGSSDFIFDCVHLLYYKCHKINLKRRWWCIDSPDRIKTKNQY